MSPNHVTPPNATLSDEQTRSGPAQSSSQSAANRAPYSKRVLSWFLFFVFALFVWQGFPREVARWQYAAYEHHSLQGDPRAALASIEKAIAWDKRNPDYWLAAGSAAMEAADYPQSWRSFDYAREMLEQDHPQAIGAIATAQNGAAYARALANTELDRASADIAAALKVVPNESAFIDTSGYIRYLQGDLEGALDETHSAVTKFESIYHSRRASIRSQQKSIRRREMNRQLRQLDEGMAELYLHRGLVYQKLGKTDAAERDLAQAEFYREKANEFDSRPRDTPAQAGKKTQDR